MQAEVGADVKGGQLSIYVGVYHCQQIYSGKGEQTEVAVSAEEILLVLEYILEAFLTTRDVVPYG